MRFDGLVAAALGGAVIVALAMPAGAQDIADGEKQFKRHCGICHVAEKDSDRRLQGPNLFGLVGRKAGTIEGFRYSDANKNSGIVWTPEVLDEYLVDPRKKIPGTIMAFAGVRKPEERKALIEYLVSLK